MTPPAHFDSSDGLFGGFSSLDGTMEFFTRVNVLLEPDYTVLDLGAGGASQPPRTAPGFAVEHQPG